MTAIDADRLQAQLAELLREHKVPGAAMGVLHDGKVTAVAAGTANKREGIEATPDTVFQIGSITKVWTATVVMQLVDEGVLDLDEPVRAVLPEFAVVDPDVSAKVTLRHLLTHTSGIEGDHFEDMGRGDDCLEKYVASCAALPQNHAPGATMSYCNAGYSVLGRVLEVVTGTTYDAVMRERLFTPLGLTHTSMLPEEAILHRVAVGHLAPKRGEEPEVAPVWLLARSSAPAGLVNSTVADVLAFARLHLDGGRAPDGTQVLSPASVEAMQQAQTDVPNPYSLGDQWGLGWALFHWDDHLLYGHDGNTIGQAAFLRVLPEANMAVTLLTNAESAVPVYRALFGELFADLAGVTIPPIPTLPDAPPSLDLSLYAGTYERLAVKADLAADDGRLSGTLTRSGPLAAIIPNPVEAFTVAPIDTTLFLATVEGSDTPTPLVFYEFEDGRPQRLHMGVRSMRRAV